MKHLKWKMHDMRTSADEEPSFPFFNKKGKELTPAEPERHQVTMVKNTNRCISRHGQLPTRP